MLKEIRQKISLSPELEKKIKWASNYSTTEINIENGTLIKLIPTNIAYVEPHKVIIINTNLSSYSLKQLDSILHKINQENEQAAAEFYKMNSNSKEKDIVL